MARITSRQAQELMDAYAKVYETKEEPAVETPVNETPVEDIQEGPLDAIPMTRSRQNRQNRINALRTDLSTSGGSTNGKTRTVSNLNKTGTAKEVGSSTNNKTPVKTQNTQSTNNTSSSGGNSGGGLKTASGNDSKLSTYAQQKVLAMKKDANTAGVKPNEGSSTVSNVNSTGTAQKVGNQSSGGSTRKGGGSVKVDGKGLMDKLRAGSGDKVQSGGGGQSTGGQKPQRGTPVNQLFGKGGSDGSPAPYTGGPNAAQRANAGTGQKPAAQGGGGQQQQPVKTVGGQGNRQRPVKTGGIQAGKAIKGGLSRLGSLAGKAVGAARSAAGNVAGGIKQGAQAVAGGIKAGAKAVGGALANKGPIQGRASGPQRRAQQAQTRAGGAQAQAKPVATRPVQGQQPAAKPVVTQQQPAAKMGQTERQNRARMGNEKVDALKAKNAQFQAAKKSGNLAQYRKDNPKMSGAQRAQQMAKQRIAAKKSAPAPVAQKQPGSGGITRSSTWDSYDPMFDDTVQFLVSEGHAKDKSEAISIMSESEFIDAFNQELNG